ncbi:MAG: InlB B-repeat-containing protein [Oscillospiraceae bacterium]|nr:InlB B-repeat-containing protein [Oscillospiraceae bacterium]
MKKRILSMLLAIVMVVGLVPGFSITASAATTGTTGEVNWSFDETTGTLTVSGTGAMADYTSGSQPWYAYKDSITTVIVEKGVTTISTNAFSQFPVLKTVKIAGSVTAIGNNAFYSCSNLTTVEYYGSSAPQASSNVFFGVYAVVKVLTTYEGNVFCGKMARATLDAANEPVSSAPDETPPAAPTPDNTSGAIYVFECSNTGLDHQAIGITFDSLYSKAGEPFKNADGEWIVEVTNNVKAMWEDHTSGLYEYIYPDYAHTPRVELPEELTVTLTWDPEVEMWKYGKAYVYYDISCEAHTATYTVTVTDDGNGTASANPASGAEGTEVSLTATPNEGYQFKEWQVLSGDVIVTDDTFTIGTANVEIKAVFEEAAPAVDYSLWIGGTRVTSLNASDVFGDGKVSYDPASNTLTLNNYSYEGEYIWSDGLTQGAAIRYEDTDTLKLVLNGESSVTYSGRERDACYGLYSKKSIVISGDGALTATATPDYGSGVYVVNGGITVESGSLTGTATGDIAIFGVYAFRGDITVKGGTLTGTASDKTRGIGVCASNSNITVESGSLTGTGYFYGIDADAITVNGGTVEATGGSQAFCVEPTIAKTLAAYDAEDQVIENPVWTGIGALTYAKIAEKPSFSVSLSIGTAYTNTATDFYRGDNGTMYCTFTFPDGVPAGRMHLYVNGEKKNASFNVTADSSSTTLKKTRSTATNLKNGENVVKFEFVPTGSTESYFTNEITVTVYKIDAARVAKHLNGDVDTTVDYDGTPKTVPITSLYEEGANTLYLAPEQYTITYWQGDQQIEEPTLPGVYDVKITVPENDYYAQITNHKLCTLTINAPATHSVYVSAVDAADGWELAGAHLQILNTAGDVIVIDGNKVEWDSTMEAKKIEGLKTDTAYTLRATVTPAGYAIASDTTFRIDAEGNVTSNGTVDAYGTILVKFDPTVVQASAVDIADGEAIAGATMQILDKDGNVELVVEEWVSTTEAHTVTGLSTGEEYILRATVAPDGYTLPTDTTFAIDQNGNIKYTGTVTEDGVLLVEFERTMVKVSAVETGAGEAIEGAHMQILDTEGKLVDEWVSAVDDEETTAVDESIHLVYSLKTDEVYTLHTEAAPAGYTIASDITFTIGEDGQLRTTGDVTEEGVILSVFDITVVQFLAVDDASGEAIAGATMQILDEYSNLVEEWVSTTDVEETVDVDESIRTVTGLNTGVEYTLRAVATPDGYTVPTDTTFSIDEQGNVTYSGKKTQDGTLLVEFAKIEYTITYVLDGGTINGEYATSYAFGDSVSLPQNVTREGYYFDGWYDAAEGGTGPIMGFGRPETGDKTFYARWTPKRYMATWTDGEGGSYEKEFDYGAVITIPTSEFFVETFRKTGYTLTQWQGYTEGMTMPEGGVTFTAIYTANDYTVSFDANGGAAIDPITVTYGEKYGNLPSSAITGLSGGSKSWYLVDENGNVTDTNIKNLTKVETARDHTLFIKRTVLAPTVKITLEVPGAISNDYQYYVPSGSTRVLTATVSNENKNVLDYTYQWYKDGEAVDGATEVVLTLAGNVSDSGTYKVVVTATLKADSNIVVTANSASAEKEQIVKILHAANTLSYDANGGENAPGSHYTGGETITVAAEKPSREHYTFAGWNTKADGTGSSYSAGSTYAFAEDNSNGGCEVTLYAKWTANTYAVTLETNRGTIREGNVTEYTYGVGAELPTAVTRPGYRFVGWYDNEACEGDPVTEITVTDHGDKTFYAKWKKTGSGSNEPTYRPEIDDDGNGDVSVYPTKPEKGDAVTIKPDPDPGYEVDDVIVTDENGRPIRVTDNGDGTYSFRQPDGKVEITVTFKEVGADCERDYTCPMNGYTDLDRYAWYHDGVHFCLENDLMNGISSNRFDSNGTTTRAMIVTILWRLEGEPVVNYAMDFSDVAANMWYTEAIRWAASEGIVEGYGDTFGPNDSITREQMAAIMWRYAKYKGHDVSVGENTNILSYDDAFDVAEWAIPAMQWACGADLINGVESGRAVYLKPADNTTRAQAAAILHRFCK